MFLENQIFPDNKIVDERISRAINNDHTAAMKAPSDGKKHKKKGPSYSSDMITVCMLCQKAFKNPVFYRKHLRLHSDKSHCPLCGKGVKKHHLPSHLQTHTQFPCPVCPKRFGQKGHLNQHLKFHSAKKTFKCPVCDKDFLQQEHLKTHLRHHNNERPFECELCHKSFNIKSSLQRHMNCHTGEKPFICGICNRGYTRRSVLMLHVQQVHENKKPFQCDECDLCFSQKGNLQAHFRRKHLQQKSDHRRGKDKEGKSMVKRGIKRSHQRPKAVKILSKNYNINEEPSKGRLSKSSRPDSSLHSYASKVKAIVSRGARAQAHENQRISSKYSKSAFPLKRNGKNPQSSGQSTSYNSMSDSHSSSSSCGLSSGEDIPEPSFPTTLESSISGIPVPEVSFDIKPLPDLESFLEGNKGWEDYMMADTDHILGSSLPHYELTDVFGSPAKSSVLLQKESDEILSTLGWTDDYTANPLFTAEDLDEIKEISGNIYGLVGVDGIKIEPCEQDRIVRSSQTSKGINHLNFNMLKGHFSGSSMQA